MAKKVRGISTMRAYNWKDHDPMIDVVRAARSDQGMKIVTLHEKSGTAASTISAWESGKTKSPMHKTLANVIIGLGAKGIEYDQGGNPYLTWRHGAPTKKRRG